MTEVLEQIIDENKGFGRWGCNECERECEVECIGSDKPPLCLYGRENYEWNGLLPLDSTLELKLKQNRVFIRECRDVNGRLFYDLYLNGQYKDSYMSRVEVEEKMRELCR